FRPGPGALSRVQALDAAQRPRRADVMDLDATGRNPDRLRRRAVAGTPYVRRGARPTRHAIAHGRRLCGGAGEPAAESSVTCRAARGRDIRAHEVTPLGVGMSKIRQ